MPPHDRGEHRAALLQSLVKTSTALVQRKYAHSTLNSDGDSTPDGGFRWYHTQGYNFPGITDHNYVTSVDGLNALHGADDKFIVIRGEGIDWFHDKPIHVNGLNLAQKVDPQVGRVW